MIWTFFLNNYNENLIFNRKHVLTISNRKLIEYYTQTRITYITEITLCLVHKIVN